MQTILKNLTGKTLVQIVIAGDQEQAILAGLSGLLNTASLENPQLVGQVILFSEQETPENIVRYLNQESEGTNLFIRYGAEGRQALSWCEAGLQPSNPQIGFKDEGVYLITGGLHGLGLVFAREILDKTKHAKVVLTGRSGLRNRPASATGKIIWRI